MPKKRRIFVLTWALLTLLQMHYVSAGIDQDHDEPTVFVFPSMQMEGAIISKLSNSDNNNQPLVEVIYRGQPNNELVKQSTTVSSSEVITTTVQTTESRGKFTALFFSSF